ncbi:MAG: FlgO family outer membrane protein [Desulfotalea sp.]
MQKSIYNYALYLLIAISICSCSRSNIERVNRSFDTNLINLTHDMVDELIETSSPRLAPGKYSPPILITTFVDNNNLKKSTQLGFVLQNHTTSRFVQQDYNVQEIKLGKELSINKQTGETILTRDKKEIDREYGAQAILVGTTARANDTLYITARLVDPTDKTIISSVDKKIIIDQSIMALMGLQYSDEIEEPEQPSEPFLKSLF